MTTLDYLHAMLPDHVSRAVLRAAIECELAVIADRERSDSAMRAELARERETVRIVREALHAPDSEDTVTWARSVARRVSGGPADRVLCRDCRWRDHDGLCHFQPDGVEHPADYWCSKGVRR